MWHNIDFSTFSYAPTSKKQHHIVGHINSPLPKLFEVAHIMLNVK